MRTLQDFLASRIVDFNYKCLSSVSLAVKFVAVLVPIWRIIQSGFLFKICLILSSMFSIVPPLKKLTFTLCLSVLRSSSLIPDISQSPTMATVRFGHFASATLLLILPELMHLFDLFQCNRLIWSACSSYVLRFKICSWSYHRFGLV